jgi:hypothetical protein
MAGVLDVTLSISSTTIHILQIANPFRSPHLVSRSTNERCLLLVSSSNFTFLRALS